ncbi:MAG: outer membrane beta-barrel protein [Saprospiraceae bacterium]|nr:outer membrane beta-barrel protein [Candidatus Vicinibacter affinis]MBP6174327.1 outer membrane beta-barrel protein [Saprospiraceae bacterium]MBP6523741.1 outer membrane beta-barrel protein [Saprospiraceae bacterium]
MLHLHRYQTIVFFVFCITTLSLSAQTRVRNYNYEGFKKKSHYFGLTLALNSSGFKVEHSRTLRPEGAFKVNEGVASPGLTLSMITNFKIGEYFDYRLLPSISLSYRKLLYVPTNGGPVQEDLLESVFGEIPMVVRFTSAPYKDARVFMLAGVKYSYDFASNSRSDKNRFDLVRISPHDFQIEIGAGMQFFLPYFIFTPEIKFSHGLNNVLIYDNKLIESTIIDKLFSRTLTISFHFEG